MRVALKSVKDGSFVSARFDEAGCPLRSNRPDAGPWETFELINLDGGSPVPPPVSSLVAFPFAGCTDFRLLQMHMAGENIQPVLDQRKACGFDLVRVLGMKTANTNPPWDLLPQHRPDYEGDLRRFLDVVCPQLRVYFTVFADTATVMPNQDEQLIWFSRIASVLRPYVPRVVLELANEWNHPTQRGFNPRAFTKPDGIFCSRGSAMTDQDPASPYWDGAGYSARRDPPPSGKGLANYDPDHFQEVYPQPCPKWAQEGIQPVAYGFDLTFARKLGQKARGFGGFFHPPQGVHSDLFDPPTQACAAAFCEGVRA